MSFDYGRRKAPLITIFGGDVTTSRLRAEKAVSRLTPFYPMSGRWTAKAPLPGGDFAWGRFENEVDEARARWRFLSEDQARRLVGAYGSNVKAILGEAEDRGDLGPAFGPELTGAEVRYLMKHEWARFPGRYLVAALKARPDHAGGGPRGAGGVHGDGDVGDGSQMKRSVFPALVVAVFGMLFGMTLRYLVDNPLEATVANYLRSGLHGIGIALAGWATHLYFASRRSEWDQQMAAVDGSGGCVPQLWPSSLHPFFWVWSRCFMGTDRSRLAG